MLDSRTRRTLRKIGRILRVAGLVALAGVVILVIAVSGYTLGWKSWQPSAFTPPPSTPRELSSPADRAPVSPSGETVIQSLSDSPPELALDKLFADARTAFRYAETEDLGVAQAHHLLGAIEESELRDAFHHAAGLPATDSRKNLIAALLMRWADIDPAAAFDALRQEFTGHEFFDRLSIITIPWARENPVAAYRAYAEHVRPGASSSPGSRAAYNLMHIFRQWSGESFDDALSEFEHLGGDEAKYALRGIASTAGENLDDPRFVDPLLALAPDAQKTALSKIARDVSQIDSPQSAIDWLETVTVEPDVRTAIESEIASEWAWDAPRAAADWALSRSEGGGNSKPLHDVIRRWADWEPNAAGRWLHQLEPGTGPADEAFAAFAIEITSGDPESALVWAAEIQSPETRRKTLKNIANQFRFRHTPDAESLVGASPLSEIEKAGVIDSLESPSR